jgi:hypothetical protein
VESTGDPAIMPGTGVERVRDASRDPVRALPLIVSRTVVAPALGAPPIIGRAAITPPAIARAAMTPLARPASTSPEVGLVFRTMAIGSGSARSDQAPDGADDVASIDDIQGASAIGGDPPIAAADAFAIARSTGTPVATGAAVETAPAAGDDGDESADPAALEKLATQIYDLIRRRLLLDRERAGARPSWFHG